MKIEEAINVLKDERYPNAVREELLEANEALDMAIEALEKQIPKEPIVLLKDEDGYAYQFEHYLCPDCKNIFAQRPQGSKAPLYTPKYCHDCGQALKWD